MKKYTVWWLPSRRCRKARHTFLFAFNELDAMRRTREIHGDVLILNAGEWLMQTIPV